jgi:hypothetical protein
MSPLIGEPSVPGATQLPASADAGSEVACARAAPAIIPAAAMETKE